MQVIFLFNNGGRKTQRKGCWHTLDTRVVVIILDPKKLRAKILLYYMFCSLQDRPLVFGGRCFVNFCTCSLSFEFIARRASRIIQQRFDRVVKQQIDCYLAMIHRETWSRCNYRGCRCSSRRSRCFGWSRCCCFRCCSVLHLMGG